MELKNAFLTGIVSKLLTKIIKKKTGLNAVIDITYLKIETEPAFKDGKELVNANLVLTACCDKDEIKDFIFEKGEKE